MKDGAGVTRWYLCSGSGTLADSTTSQGDWIGEELQMIQLERNHVHETDTGRVRTKEN